MFDMYASMTWSGCFGYVWRWFCSDACLTTFVLLARPGFGVCFFIFRTRGHLKTSLKTPVVGEYPFGAREGLTLEDILNVGDPFQENRAIT